MCDKRVRVVQSQQLAYAASPRWVAAQRRSRLGWAASIVTWSRQQMTGALAQLRQRE